MTNFKFALLASAVLLSGAVYAAAPEGNGHGEF